jgi:hypothetical protein
MKQLYLVVCAAIFLGVAAQAQSVKASSYAEYGAKNTFDFFADYSNDSSHIFIGQEQNRRIAGLGAGYSLRLAHKRFFDFSYEAELRPLYFVRDPVVSGTSTVVLTGFPSTIPFEGPFSGPVMANCTSGTTVTTVTSPMGSTTQTITQQCGSRWTYAGGISPLGLRFGFAKRHRLQPFFVANGGFLVTPHDEPVNNSARFNFTFEGGVGVEWFRDHRHSFTFDYRVHHLSNGYRGMFNPGIDSSIFRVGYRFGR